MSHCTHLNELCRGCKWVKLDASLYTRAWGIIHTWMSHDTHVNESYNIYKWIQLDVFSPTPDRIITHTRRIMCYKRMPTNMSHCATLMHESRHKYERASSHTWTNHTRERVMSSDDRHINESQMTHISMSHIFTHASYEWLKTCFILSHLL